MPVDQEFDNVLAWAKEHDQAFAERIETDPVYFKKILNIEKNRPNPRKDYAKYSDIYPLIRFFFEDEYEKIVSSPLPFQEKFTKELLTELLEKAANEMPFGVDEMTWFNQIKEIGFKLGFASSNKDYKKDPSAFKGSLSDVAEIIRIALVGGTQSPNLHEIIEILGKETCQKRMLEIAKKLGK